MTSKSSYLEKLATLKIWVLVSLLLFYVVHVLFYKNTDFIYKFNRIIEPNEISPSLRGWYVEPRDGLEPLVLCIAMAVIVILAMLFSKIRLTAIFKNHIFIL